MAHLLLASIDGPDGFSKPCVIKRILPEYANLEAFSRMFADEAKVAALLTHPNIVQVFDFGKIEGQYYLAMEWIQGQSLDRVMRHAWKGTFPLGARVAVDVGLAISDALAYAHAKTLPDGTPLKLVHRDVTPGNVLVSRDANTARQLVLEMDRLRDVEKQTSQSHFLRLRDGTIKSVETSSIHLDTIRDLKQINSLLASMAYPVLEEQGLLRGSRLKAS